MLRASLQGTEDLGEKTCKTRREEYQLLTSKGIELVLEYNWFSAINLIGHWERILLEDYF